MELQIGSSWPWWIKVSLLLFGSFHPILGLPLLFLDGLFHTFTPENELRKRSPDWVIARNVLQSNGFSPIVHKAVGIFLLLTSLLVFSNIYIVDEPKNETLAVAENIYVKGIMPLTLVIISLGIGIRALYQDTSSQSTAFL